MLVRVGMAPRPRGVSYEAFQEHWRGTHGPLVTGMPGLRRYVQNHAVLRDGRPLLPYAGFDACAETEFDDLAAMHASFASPLYRQAITADEQELIERARFSLLLAERRVLAEHGGPEQGVKLLTFLRVHPGSTRVALLEALAGEYAETVAAARPLRHEQLVGLAEPDPDSPPQAADAVDLLWFADADAALAFLGSAAAHEADSALAGRAFGRERLLAHPVRVL